MTLIVLAYLAGVLTLLSPCVLPILPFVFARAGQPFVRSILPLLVGLAVTFTGLALLVSIGGGWIVQANEVGRMAATALAAVAVIGLGLDTSVLAKASCGSSGSISSSASPARLATVRSRSSSWTRACTRTRSRSGDA